MIQHVLVQPGTTLFRVAANLLGDATQWIRIAQLNDIDDPFSFAAPRWLSIPTVRPGLQ